MTDPILILAVLGVGFGLGVLLTGALLRKRVSAPPPGPPRARPDLEQLAIDTLRAKGTDRANGLADEIERGRRRRAQADSGPLHAHELTSDDAAMIRALGGAKFGPDATVILPSGRKATGAEMRRWTEEEA